ncbi:tyrosine-type recombinase/integrase [Streptomyces sp. WA6-1-16]|nr:tyrosine-type recombinase/integrase [Streptomyces sp. WA6-1-16]
MQRHTLGHRGHKLGYEHLRRHDLRHTALTWFADAGAPVYVLRRIAGHGSLTTTQRYLTRTSARSRPPGRRSAHSARCAHHAHCRAQSS